MSNRESFNIERSIGRLEGKLDSLIVKVESLDRAFVNLEAGRLTNLEKNFANLSGKLTIIAGVVSFVISLGFIILQRYFSIK